MLLRETHIDQRLHQELLSDVNKLIQGLRVHILSNPLAALQHQSPEHSCQQNGQHALLVHFERIQSPHSLILVHFVDNVVRDWSTQIEKVLTRH